MSNSRDLDRSSIPVFNTDATGAPAPGGSSADPVFNKVQGVDAQAAAPTANPVTTGGVGSTAQPTAVTVGQIIRNWLSLTGATIIGGIKITSSRGINNAAEIWAAASDGTSGQWGMRPYIYNPGSTGWDIQSKSRAPTRVSTSAASGNPAVALAGPGDLLGLTGECGAIKTYIQFYNSTAAPIIGTTPIAWTYPVPANTVFDKTLPFAGLPFLTGVAYALTTDYAGTTAAAAGALVGLCVLVA